MTAKDMKLTKILIALFISGLLLTGCTANQDINVARSMKRAKVWEKSVEALNVQVNTVGDNLQEYVNEYVKLYRDYLVKLYINGREEEYEEASSNKMDALQAKYEVQKQMEITANKEARNVREIYTKYFRLQEGELARRLGIKDASECGRWGYLNSHFGGVVYPIGEDMMIQYGGLDEIIENRLPASLLIMDSDADIGFMDARAGMDFEEIQEKSYAAEIQEGFMFSEYIPVYYLTYWDDYCEYNFISYEPDGSNSWLEVLNHNLNVEETQIVLSEEQEQIAEDFLSMESEGFEAKYDRDELYEKKILYCDNEAWKYHGTQLDGFQEPEDYYDVKNITALRFMDVLPEDKVINQSGGGISERIYIECKGDYAISMYLFDYSYIKAELQEGTAPKKLYDYLEDDYYEVREELKETKWMASPDGTKKACVSGGALPGHPSQIFVRYQGEKADDVFRRTSECEVVGWINENHLVCNDMDTMPILIHLETGEVENIKKAEDDYDTYGAKYRISADTIICECLGEEIYRWDIVRKNGEISLIGAAEKEAALEWFEQWIKQLDSDERLRDKDSVKYHAEVVQYMIEQPSSFIFHVNKFSALDLSPGDHRNVNKDCLVDENGEGKNILSAYIADIVIDKFIREYDGEDIKYDIINTNLEEWAKHPGQVDLFIYYCTIKGDSVTIRVIYSYESSIVIALIEGDENAETRTEEYIKFLQQEDSRSWTYSLSAERKRYWMIINKDNLKDNYHYRNVVASDELSDSEDLKCGVQEYYIADQAINRYILDEHGSDEIYEVTLLDRKQDADGNTKYTLSVSDESGKEVLQIEYEDDSWWVTVTIL